MSKINDVKEQENNAEKGQTFLEFILLFLLILTMSGLMVKGINGSLGDRWIVFVKKIVGPTTSSIELR
jgi:uncharacterized protein (UPF0333 family)